jgi:hypothetical protein
MASTSKGKGTIAQDWRYRICYENNVPITPEDELAKLRLPFELRPETTQNIPSEFSHNANFLTVTTTPVEGQFTVPWTGYYVTYNGANFAVSNAFGVWFEIRRREETWEAFRVARPQFQLKDWPAEGINYAVLLSTGDAMPQSRAPSRASTFGFLDTPGPQQVPIQTVGVSSFTPRQLPPKKPRQRKGRGHSPSDSESSDDDDKEKEDKGKPRRLEGVVPSKFNGDRSRTEDFLHEFKRYARMNAGADIMRDPYKKCDFFLSLMEGEDTRGFVYQQGDWLDRVIDDPDELPWRMNAWQALEAEYKKAFIDYAEQEKANDDLRKLRMKGENVDAYIAQFRQLAYRGKHDLNEPEIQRLFAMGLPIDLRKNCNLIQDPNTFDEWANAAQRNHRIWLRERGMKGEQAKKPSPFANMAWKSNNQGKGKGGGWNPRQFAPRDPNAMDTSATVRKATTDEEKKKHREEGRCFRCSRQGHISRNCPDRQNSNSSKARVTTSNEEQPKEEKPPTYDSLDKGNTLAEFAMKLTDEERDIFIKKVTGEEDFQNA